MLITQPRKYENVFLGKPTWQLNKLEVEVLANSLKINVTSIKNSITETRIFQVKQIRKLACFCI